MLGDTASLEDAFDNQFLSEQAVNNISEELMPQHLLFSLFITINQVKRLKTTQQIELYPSLRFPPAGIRKEAIASWSPMQDDGVDADNRACLQAPLPITRWEGAYGYPTTSQQVHENSVQLLLHVHSHSARLNYTFVT